MTPHTFHPLTTKQIGDRVKIHKHPASGTDSYFYGTVIHRPLHDHLEVEWDKVIPYLGKYTTTYCSILV
jgi:hypothetical protein